MYKTKKWIVGEADENRVAQISKKFGLSPLTSRIIYLRGLVEDEEIQKFLKKDKSCFYDPFLLHDMQKAVNHINQAVKDNTKIAVYGDYDVDGITATYIVYHYLKSRGANVIYYIPDRAEEGYGINTTAIDCLCSMNIKLIVTVDVGITAVDEISYARKKGIDVIVTDHHTLKDSLPECIAVMNPKIPGKYPYDSLAGVGAAFKLVYAVSGMDEEIIQKYCEIAALGTIADMVPLTDENRYIVYEGLKKLNSGSNIGIKSLLEVAGLSGKEITASTIGYAIAPRLNAAGRIASATRSVELLLEEDKIKALEAAAELDEENKLRQQEEQKILSEALEIIYRDKLYENEVIIVAKEYWHHGVIGIVSSRITEMFYKPSAVVSINADGTGKASGRSIKGFNLFDALSACSEYLQKFGGHELAAGFTVYTDKFEEFRNEINAYAQKLITEEIAIPKLAIDAVLGADNITIETVNELKVLEPCGIGNRAPLFCIEDAKIKGIKYLQIGKHAFLTLVKNNISMESPAFNMAEQTKYYIPGDSVSVAGSLNLNTYRGITSPQFITRNICVSPKFEITKQILADIFICIKNNINDCSDGIPADSFVSSTGGSYSMSIVLIALKIFSELGIADFEYNSENQLVKVTKGANFNSKNNLSVSQTYKLYNGKEG